VPNDRVLPDPDLPDRVLRDCVAPLLRLPMTRASTAVVSLRLLVVDDDPLSTSFQAHLASLLGHRATVSNDPVQSLSLALTGEFDLLLLDLGMPNMDGFDVLRQLREHEAADRRRHLPVIAVTGYASDADRLRCLAAGFNDHLSKPIQANSLSAAIERVIAAGTPGARAAAPASDAERLRATVQRLSEVKPGDRAFAPTVTESFALRSAQLIETLRAAAQRHDLEQTQRAARALKSSAEFLGALRLAQMCTDYEGDAKAGAWPELPARLQAIDHEHQAVLTLLFESSR
jgi:CheY-like chemotaxis protein